MRVLLALVHYFRAEEASRHSSTDAHRRDQRAAALREAINSWRGTFGTTTQINIETKRYERLRGAVDGLDICVITNGEDHLLDEAHAKARGVRHIKAKVDNPRMLGFAAQRLFADARNAYDLFCFSEDDLRLRDAGFLAKIAAFQDAFGWRRVLMPNRFEWNARGHTLKTWIDGDLRPGAIARLAGSAARRVPSCAWPAPVSAAPPTRMPASTRSAPCSSRIGCASRISSISTAVSSRRSRAPRRSA